MVIVNTSDDDFVAKQPPDPDGWPDDPDCTQPGHPDLFDTPPGGFKVCEQCQGLGFNPRKTIRPCSACGGRGYERD